MAQIHQPAQRQQPARPVSTYDPAAQPGLYRETWYDAMLRQFNPDNLDWGQWLDERRQELLEQTVAKIQQLIRWGYPKSLINRDGLRLESVGIQLHALQGKTSFVAVKSARKIRDFFSRIETIRALWQARRGTIPHGHFVYWKRGKHEACLKHLELRPVARGYKYHYLYPAELKAAIRLTNQLKRVYRERSKNEEHHG